MVCSNLNSPFDNVLRHTTDDAMLAPQSSCSMILKLLGDVPRVFSWSKRSEAQSFYFYSHYRNLLCIWH